jgi:hypothetical protein
MDQSPTEFNRETMPLCATIGARADVPTADEVVLKPGSYRGMAGQAQEAQ